MSVQNAATTKMVQNVIDGTTPPTEAGNVTAEINGHAISDIFEEDGVTVQNASLAAQATKLATGRTIRTNLGSTAAPSFDGTANVSPGVTGTLPVANGGTGQTDLANVTVGNATSAEKVAKALTVTVNGTETAYDGSSAQSVTVAASNPNLLDNSNFAINQGGGTSWSSVGQTVDRWRLVSGTGIVGTGTTSNGKYHYIRANNYNMTIRQYIERPLKYSTNYTITIGYADSSAAIKPEEISGTVTIGSSGGSVTWDTGIGTAQVVLYVPLSNSSSGGHAYVSISRITSLGYIYYIKLEEGDVATPYEIPDPATELLKCQRYYVKCSEDFQIVGTVSGTANIAYVTMFLPATMRTIPTIVSWGGNNIRLNGSNYSTVDDVDVQGCENNKLYLKIHTSADYPNMAICIWFGNSLELSAELTS